jgi:hypothetical protein
MKYAVTASFSGVLNDEYMPCETSLDDVLSAWATYSNVVAEPSEPGDSEYAHLAEEGDDNWWLKMSDVQMSDIFSKRDFESLIEDWGAYAEGVETMDTLGGPANPIGWAPDISFRIESRILIDSIRVTPIPKKEPESEQEARELWDNLRSKILKKWGRR